MRISVVFFLLLGWHCVGILLVESGKGSFHSMAISRTILSTCEKSASGNLKKLSISGLHLCYSYSCEPHQRRRGCRITNRRCSCDDFGCSSEYRYETYEECQKALKGKRQDSCNPNPCLHGGSCIQISQSPGFKCRCEGTGYFGVRCNRACPKGGPGRHEIFPYECIVI